MTTFDSLTSRLQTIVQSNETIAWTGAPPAGLRLRAVDALLIPFSVMWGGFAFFWESTVVSHGAPVFMEIWGIPFVAIGIYLIVGRFFVDAYMRAHTRYAITNRAAYIARFGPLPVVRRFAGSALDVASLQPSNGDRATIRLAQPLPYFGAFGGGRGLWIDASTDAFEQIPDARHVFDLLTATR